MLRVPEVVLYRIKKAKNTDKTRKRIKERKSQGAEVDRYVGFY